MVMDEAKKDPEGQVPDGKAIVSYWLKKLEAETKAHETFRKEAEEAERAYYDDRKDARKNLFPIFWANIQTIHAALYGKTPQPDVRRRHAEQIDPTDPQAQQKALQDTASRGVAKALERSLAFLLDTEDFDGAAHRMIDDFLIAGLGVPWVQYNAVVSGSEETQQIDLQKIGLLHVAWKRFRWEPGKDWDDCDWIARDLYLVDSELKDQFDVTAPTGGGTPKQDVKDRDSTDKYAPQYLVTEIWYKPARKVYVIGWDFDEPLEVREDALQLEGFYPCPKPLFSNLKSKELVPKPDYAFYAQQCDFVNTLTQRITNLTKQIKEVGFYDAQLKELAQLTNASDGDMIPLANLAERVGAAGSSDWQAVLAKLPNDTKAKVLEVLVRMREQAKETIYEITGISDIVRGASDPNETMGAQVLKTQWGSLRMARRKQEVAVCFRGVFRIMAEIIAEHFTPEQIYLMSGVSLDQGMLSVLRSDVGRTFAIDVETDSTVAADEQAEQSQRLKMLETATKYIQVIMPMVHQGAVPADLAKEMLLTAVASFKYGKSLEDAINKMPGSIQQLQQAQQQIQQGQQQLEQLGKAHQDAQQQLEKAQQDNQGLKVAEQQRKGVETQIHAGQAQADNQLKGTQAMHEAVLAEKERMSPVHVSVMQ
jgi:hypothetical protein